MLNSEKTTISQEIKQNKLDERMGLNLSQYRLMLEVLELERELTLMEEQPND